MNFKFPEGATPIELDELQDLIPDFISTLPELNQLEQSNIADAYIWAEKQSLDDLLTVSFAMELHKHMFEKVWKWAGKMRRSNKNIGSLKEQIMNDVGQLLKNVQYWIDNSTFPSDEIGARFHHRLVQVHIFPNGNGRHSRLMTNLLLKKINGKPFSWGDQNDSPAMEYQLEAREKYISALKAADGNNFLPLLTFVRS